MAKTKAVKEAEARVAALQAVIDERDAAMRAANEATEPARKRHEAICARLARQLLLTSAGGQPNSDHGAIRQTNLASLGPSWMQEVRGMSERALAEALAKGEVRIAAGGYGTSYGLRGYLQRTRLVTKPQLRAIEVAIRRRQRAEAALREAWRREREAYSDTFEAAEKPDLATVAAAIAKRLTASAKAQAAPIPNELNRRAWEAERSMHDARTHLAHAQSGSPDPCMCWQCQGARDRAAREAQEAERIAALPSILAFCPEHGRRHRMKLGRAHARFDGQPVTSADGSITVEVEAGAREVPALICVGKTERKPFVYVKALAAELRAEARERAKLPRVVFTCPNPECGEEVESIVEPGGAVSCDACEAAYMVDTLNAKPVGRRKAA